MFLSKNEDVPVEQQEFFHRLMKDSPCDLILVSKFGAVAEARAIIDGLQWGRKRHALQRDDVPPKERLEA